MGPQAVPNTVGIQFGLATHLELVKNVLEIKPEIWNFSAFFWYHRNFYDTRKKADESN